MSTSSNAFERLLKDGNYFNKKILDFLKFRGDKKKTGETAAEFLCGFYDKRSDIVQAVKSIKDVFTKIETSYESDDAAKCRVIDRLFPVGTFGESGKDYLYRLFDLFKIDHKIFLYCLERKWEKATYKLKEMKYRKKGGEIIDEFDLENKNSSLYIVSGCCEIAVLLEENVKCDEGYLLRAKRKYSHRLKEVRRLFPDVARYLEKDSSYEDYLKDYLKNSIEKEAPPSKKRKIDPTKDD